MIERELAVPVVRGVKSTYTGAIGGVLSGNTTGRMDTEGLGTKDAFAAARGDGVLGTGGEVPILMQGDKQTRIVDRTGDVTFGAQAAGAAAGDVPTAIGMGNHATQARSQIDRTRDVTFGRDAGGEVAEGEWE